MGSATCLLPKLRFALEFGAITPRVQAMRFSFVRRRLQGAAAAPRPAATRTFSDKSPPPKTDAHAKQLGAASIPDIAAVPDTNKVLRTESLEQQAASMYASLDVGQAQTMEFRRFLTTGGAKCSAWHDVPLFAKQSASSSSTVLNACVEITRGTRAKMEISTTEVF